MSSGALAEPGLTFDDILGAVQESSRGRWFLDEFQKRHEDKGSAKILAAISKIEARIESMAHVHEPVGELTKLRGAIATARREIALQENPSSELSAEGRMFAKLAEMARKTLPASAANDSVGNLTTSVVRALSLIDEIDVTLNGGSAPPTIAAVSSDSYFKADSALFEPATKPMWPVLVTSPPSPVVPVPVPAPQLAKPIVEPPMITAAKDDDQKKGAKLVINRLPAPASLAAPEAENTELHATLAAPQPNVLDEAVTKPEAPTRCNVEPTADVMLETKPTPRIVIVRRKPEDMESVPLSEPAAESAA